MSFYIATITFFLSIEEVGDKKVIKFFYSTHEKEKSRFLYKSRLSNDFLFLKYKN
jgi:hypothetical protein